MKAGCLTASRAVGDGKPLRRLVDACLCFFSSVNLLTTQTNVWRSLCSRASAQPAGIKDAAAAPSAAEVNAAATPPTGRERTKSKYSRRLCFQADGLAAPNIYHVCRRLRFKTANKNAGRTNPFLLLRCLISRIGSGERGGAGASDQNWTLVEIKPPKSVRMEKKAFPSEEGIGEMNG